MFTLWTLESQRLNPRLPGHGEKRAMQLDLKPDPRQKQVNVVVCFETYKSSAFTPGAT